MPFLVAVEIRFFGVVGGSHPLCWIKCHISSSIVSIIRPGCRMYLVFYILIWQVGRNAQVLRRTLGYCLLEQVSPRIIRIAVAPVLGMAVRQED
jgi:hypothetical protein